jgi:kynurenine formamidase
MKSWFPSKWGERDQLGSLNEVTQQHVIEALKLPKEGRVYELGYILEDGIPTRPFHGPFLYTTFRRPSDAGNEFDSVNVRIEMPDQVGTHLDALNHVCIGGRHYNGLVSRDIISTFGTSRLGIETTPPIITRGVMIDVAKLKRVEMLAANYAITPDDIAMALENVHTSVRRGDTVLFRTGWGKLWMKDNAKYSGAVPGIGKKAGEWVVDNGVAIVGSDTWDVEIDPPEDPAEPDVCHRLLIVKNGVRLLENMFLEELSVNNIAEFLFICLPLKIKGASGSPVFPIAVV